MNRKKLNHYYKTRIEEEQIPEFSTIRPLLKEKKTERPKELRISLTFYSAFSCLAAVIVTASFLYTSPFPGTIARGYRQSNFEPYAQKKVSHIESYLSEIRTYKKGGN